MKGLRQFTRTLILLLSGVVMAQQGINYKAQVKDENGNIVKSQSVIIQFTIYQGESLSNNVYQEIHSTTTDSNGIVVVNIGEGTVDSGVFDDINWGLDDHFLNVQIDTGEGLIDMGTTQFMSVPYAKYADKINFSYFYADKDGDGYGDNWDVLYSPLAPSNFVSLAGDCDDYNPNIYPGAAEI